MALAFEDELEIDEETLLKQTLHLAAAWTA
jgi:hypothetical protein